MKRRIISIGVIVFFVFSLIGVYVKLYSIPVVRIANTTDPSSDSLILQVTDSLRIDLDSATSPGVVSNEQYIPQHDRRYLVFLNIVSRSIYFYDTEQNRTSKVIRLDPFGFTSDDGVQGICVLSPDSVLVYSYRKSRWTVISESKGKVAQGNLDIEKQSFLTVYPFVTTYSPMIYDRRNTQVYFAGTSNAFGNYEKDKQRNVLLSLDLKTGDISNNVNYPEIYCGTNWGGISGFERLSHTYNAADGLVVFNFMADNELTVFDTKTRKTHKVQAGSKYFSELKSLPFHPLLTDINRGKVEEHYQNNFAYLNVTYDKFRKMYYRLSDFPARQAAGKASGTHILKQHSIVLLDERFQRVGEVMLPLGRYNIDSFFVSEKGLHIRRSDVKNDEFLLYDCFVPQPVNMNDHHVLAINK